VTGSNEKSGVSSIGFPLSAENLPTFAEGFAAWLIQKK
jgi:hypothetical protein